MKPSNNDFCLDQQYADDISWGSTEEKNLQRIEKVVPEVLKERNLLVNESKQRNTKYPGIQNRTGRNVNW